MKVVFACLEILPDDMKWQDGVFQPVNKDVCFREMRMSVYAVAVGLSWLLLHQVALYSMYVACMAFHAKVSDPLIGGTYMTLLNTVTNLGGNWPSTMALWLVDPLTSKECRGAVEQSCGSAAAAEVNRQPHAIGPRAPLHKPTVLPSLLPPAVRQRGRRLRDHPGRLLRGVGGVCGHRADLVVVAGEEDQRAAGEGPRRLEVQSGWLTKRLLTHGLQAAVKAIVVLLYHDSSVLFFYF